jgi:hypothetical protein
MVANRSDGPRWQGHRARASPRLRVGLERHGPRHP